MPTAAATPAGFATAAFVGPVSYLANRADGQVELHLADEVGDQVLATDADGFSTLAWSPDGRLGAAVIASASERTLIIIDISKKEARRTLTAAAGGRLAFRPAADWSRLAAQRDGEIWSVALPDGATRQVGRTAGSLAQWGISGDGAWFLAGVEAEGHYVTTLFDAAGKQGVEVSSVPHPLTEFSPDGRWLALAGQMAGESVSRLRLVDLRALPAEDAVRVVAAGSQVEPALLSTGDAPLFFTADGSWMAYLVDAGGGPRLRLRELAGDARPEFILQSNEQLRWLVVYPALRRALLVAGNVDDGARSFYLRLLYLDQQVSVPLLDGLADATLLSAPGNVLAAVDALLPDGQHYLTLVDLVKGSSRIVLRGRLRPLAVEPAGGRTLVALSLGTQEEVHLLDLKTGGTLTYMGRSVGGADRLAVGRFAPAGPAVWAWLWQPDGTAQLVLGSGAERVAQSVAARVSDALFSADGSALVFAGEAARGAGVYLLRADGTGLRFVGAGRAPRWHPRP